MEEKRFVIAIGREYGSGGREIGKLLAERLGIPFYDKDLIAIAAEQSGLSKDLLESVDEKATNPFLYSLTMGATVRGHEILTEYNLPMNDQLFIIQSKVIKDLAEKGSCIFVGRCADAVLKDDPDLIRIFIHADDGTRIDRISRRHDIPAEKAKKLMIKTDKRRKSYYNYYADKQWGAVDSYDLLVDAGKLGVEKTVELLATYVKLR